MEIENDLRKLSFEGDGYPGFLREKQINGNQTCERAEGRRG